MNRFLYKNALISFWESTNPLIYHRFKEGFTSKYDIGMARTLCGLVGGGDTVSIVSRENRECCLTCEKIYNKLSEGE